MPIHLAEMSKNFLEGRKNFSPKEGISKKKSSHTYQPKSEGNASDSAGHGQKKNGRCNYCKVLDHYIAECPKRFANEKKRKVTNSSFVAPAENLNASSHAQDDKMYA